MFLIVLQSLKFLFIQAQLSACEMPQGLEYINILEGALGDGRDCEFEGGGFGAGPYR